MNKNLELTEKIERSVKVDVGKVINEVLEVYKRTWVQGLLLILFNGLLMIPLVLMIYIPLLGMALSQNGLENYSPDDFTSFFEGYSIVYIIIILLAFLVTIIITHALNLGFYKAVKRVDLGESFKISDFFFFIKYEYFGKILLLAIVSMLMSILGMLFFVLPFFYVLVPISFFSVVFALNTELSASDVIKASFKLGNKNWLQTILVMLIALIVFFILYVVTCGLGNLFFSCLVYLPAYVVYKFAIGFKDNDEIDLIGKTNNI